MGARAPRAAGSVSARTRGDRLALLAHELRSPVAALAAIASAYGGSAAHERPRLLELAAAACGGIERLVVEASVASVRLETVDAGAIASAAAEAASLCGIPTYAVVEQAVPTVLADPLRLRQALDNLIANAVGHSAPGAEIAVGVRSDGARLLLSVADRGEGIPPEALARVFEPGVRLTERRAGSGLGLAIVAEIASAHGGGVEVESEPGRGATFTIALPLAAGPPG